MGRAAVRTAIADYLTSGIGTIPSLSKVYAHPPKITPEGEFFSGETTGVESGAVVYVHLATQSERRIAIGGPTSGRKARPYEVYLICFLRSVNPDAEVAGAANDDFLDGLTSWIEANRTANSSAIFQWGEGDKVGEPDVIVKSNTPRPLRQQMTQVFSTVEVLALEILDT